MMIEHCAICGLAMWAVNTDDEQICIECAMDLQIDMASRNTYECFMCKKAGFPDTRVYLDGKTEDGKTVYKNEDMSPHQHKQGNGQQQRGSTTIITQATQNDIIIKKLDEIIVLLGEVKNNATSTNQKLTSEGHV